MDSSPVCVKELKLKVEQKKLQWENNSDSTHGSEPIKPMF